jgi:hypothetical protein
LLANKIDKLGEINEIAGLGEINKIAGLGKIKQSFLGGFIFWYISGRRVFIMSIKITLSDLKFFQNQSAINFTSSFKVKRLSLLDFKPLSGPPPHGHSLRYITSSRSTPQKYPIVSVQYSVLARNERFSREVLTDEGMKTVTPSQYLMPHLPFTW